MAVLLRELIAERGEPLCVRQETKLSDALKQMLENDYSQLPIVDQRGKLTGVVSEQSIVRTYFNHPRTFSLDLTVNECSTSPMVMRRDDELSEALNRIKDVDAIVIISEANKPVGILTDYDTTHFLRDLFETYTLIEDIEVSVGDIIERILYTDEQRQEALICAFGRNPRDPTKPSRVFDKLTLHDKVQLVITDDNWPKFEAVFNSRKFFDDRMQRVGDIRNRLMHFHGKPDSLQYQALKDAAQWAKSLRPPALVESEQKTSRIEVPEAKRVPAGARIGIYDLLREWLEDLAYSEHFIQVSFEELEKLLGAPLPPSAYEHRSWWANVKEDHPQARAWLDAGWRVDHVDFAKHDVTFQLSNAGLMQHFFADVLGRLKEVRPTATQASKTQPMNWFWFWIGPPGFYLGWSFGRGDVLRVDLYMASSDKAVNAWAFAELEKQKAQIEEEIGMHLMWEPRPENVQKLVRVTRTAKITDEPGELEVAKQWAVETMVKFLDVFAPRIKRLEQ